MGRRSSLHFLTRDGYRFTCACGGFQMQLPREICGMKHPALLMATVLQAHDMHRQGWTRPGKRTRLRMEAISAQAFERQRLQGLAPVGAQRPVPEVRSCELGEVLGAHES